MLAHLMLEWEGLQRKADELAGVIEAHVLSKGKTVVVGDARCTYYQDRIDHAYDQAGIPDRLIAQHRETKIVIDYKSAYDQWKEEELDVPEVPIKKFTPAHALLKLEK